MLFNATPAEATSCPGLTDANVETSSPYGYAKEMKGEGMCVSDNFGFSALSHDLKD